MSAMKEKILLVEDDETIASGLLYALEKEGCRETFPKTDTGDFFDSGGKCNTYICILHANVLQ